MTDVVLEARAHLSLWGDRTMRGEDIAVVRSLISEVERLRERPVLPEKRNAEARDAAISAMGGGVPDDEIAAYAEVIRLYHNHLYRVLTKPATKEVEVEQWAILGADGAVWGCHRTEESAKDAGKRLGRNWGFHTVVRLTGKATVPS